MTNQHATLVLAATLAAAAGAPASAGTLQLGHITFTAAIPAVRKPLPLFRLSRTAAPAALIRALAGTEPHVSIEGARLVARDAHGTLQAFADGRSGEAQLLPDFRSTGAPAQPAAIEGVTSGMFARTAPSKARVTP